MPISVCFKKPSGIGLALKNEWLTQYLQNGQGSAFRHQGSAEKSSLHLVASKGVQAFLTR
jgi:hypothetical protein